MLLNKLNPFSVSNCLVSFFFYKVLGFLAGSCWSSHLDVTFRGLQFGIADSASVVLNFIGRCLPGFVHLTAWDSSSFPCGNQCFIQSWTQAFCRLSSCLCAVECYILSQCCKLLLLLKCQNAHTKTQELVPTSTKEIMGIDLDKYGMNQGVAFLCGYAHYYAQSAGKKLPYFQPWNISL